VTGGPDEPAGRGWEYPPLESYSYPPPPPPGYPVAGSPPAYPYPPPYQGYPVDPYPRRSAGTNPKAVGSLIASLVGLLCCGLPSIAGVVFGVIAMRETKSTGQEGYGMALAGTIIGGFVVAVWLMILFLWLLGTIVGANSPTY
jgi:Domain of unknown function (DUF4190)